MPRGGPEGKTAEERPDKVADRVCCHEMTEFLHEHLDLEQIKLESYLVSPDSLQLVQ